MKRKVIRNKKGAAHFEMVMAFVLFIGFTVFLFTLIKPYDERTLPEAALDGIFASIQEQMNTSYETITLDLPSPPTTCVLLDLNESLFQNNVEDVHVRDINDNVQTAIYTGNTLEISSTKTFYQLAFSPDFNDTETNIGCTDTPITSYNLGGVLSTKMLSLRKLQNLEYEYKTQYENTKTKLGVPPIYDFSLESNDAGINMKGQVAETGNVLAKEFIIEVLNAQTGEVINTRFNLKLW